MRLFVTLPVALLSIFAVLPGDISAQTVSESPSVILTRIPFSLTVDGGTSGDSVIESVGYTVETTSGRTLAAGSVEEYSSVVLGEMIVEDGGDLPLRVTVGETTTTVDATVVPGWFSILPPLLAILLALIFREVLSALFAGVWLGALAVAGFDPLAATGALIADFVVPAVGDTDGGHTQIVVFSLMLGGMVGIVSKNGGTSGIVSAVTPFARTARRGKIATWLAGMAIFFDDYANTLIVGNTLRPVTDRLRISREKLAYLVDSTAAPVAALVPISTWVGYEISLIADGFSIASGQTPAAAAALSSVTPFGVFVETIPHLFYPILALIFVILTSALNRDFGSMWKAERRAETGNGLYREGATLAADTSDDLTQAKEGVRERWWNAAIPVLTVIVVVLVGLVQTGRETAMANAAAAGEVADLSLRNIFGNADPFSTLLWGSLAGVLVAMLLSISTRTLSLRETLGAWATGIRAMMLAMVILTLAWSLGSVTEEIGTASYLSALLTDRVSVSFMPAIVFLLSAGMAFATGTSWGVMAIMLPVVIPLTVALGGDAVLPGGASYGVLLGATGSVLAGAIFGDHCSPISDTTVLSSTASACDHVDHVRTQLPYAVLVGGVAIVVGSLGTSFGLPNWLALVGSAGLLVGFLFWRGRTVGT
ncbi:MAG: Na+/H+ antiporter NhaC family protein [Gemmatimonadetes bacterium]|nr:Na+/H+ antiporter NhaC family protein [Gemmatimonadota bacterium]